MWEEQHCTFRQAYLIILGLLNIERFFDELVLPRFGHMHVCRFGCSLFEAKIGKILADLHLI